jgi:hypothetical protein
MNWRALATPGKQVCYENYHRSIWPNGLRVFGCAIGSRDSLFAQGVSGSTKGSGAKMLPRS